MDAAEESFSAVYWRQNPVHGGVGEDFVEGSSLELGFGCDLGCIKDLLVSVFLERKRRGWRTFECTYFGKRRVGRYCLFRRLDHFHG